MTDTERKYYLLGQAVRMSLMAGQREQWETLFEGTVETVARTGYNGAAVTIGNTSFFTSEGVKVRLTVDGTTNVFTTQGDWSGGICAGNAWLTFSDHEFEDDIGYDYCVDSYTSLISATEFLSREPGTYIVKIERAVN